MISVTQMELFPISKMIYDDKYKYWFFTVEYVDLPMQSITVHKCEDEIDAMQAIEKFSESHVKQCLMDIKRHLADEEVIDPMIRKKYL